MTHHDPRPSLIARTVEHRLDLSPVAPRAGVLEVLTHLLWIAAATSAIGITVIALVMAAMAVVR